MQSFREENHRMRKLIAGLQVDESLFHFMDEALEKHPTVKREQFWPGFAALLNEFGRKNQALLDRRDELQHRIDAANRDHRAQKFDVVSYRKFLEQLGYLIPQPNQVTVVTEGVDSEITQQPGPQLVVPVGNARYALNAANARWGSLYDALYGTDVIDQAGELAPGQTYNPKRGQKVIAFAKDILDSFLPLEKGSHKDVVEYGIDNQRLIAKLADGHSTYLKDQKTLVGYTGSFQRPASILFKHHGLHLDILIDRDSDIGKVDTAGIKDIILEAAVSTIMDFEDSSVAVDGEDKTLLYRNWLGLLTGDLEASVSKGGKEFTRRLNEDRRYTAIDGKELVLKGRSLLFVRHVGHLMRTSAILDEQGQEVFEGIVDGVVTALLAPQGFQSRYKNSETNAVYVVKPKMHGPEEVAFTNELFTRIEELTNLPKNTLKVGLMDEERRTSLNLAACIHEVRERLVFINTGFLDRTGDEIHTSMQLGPMVRKEYMKNQAWFQAYELNNVEIGLRCGLLGRAQIGKGMWAMPDEMALMLKEKIVHPRSGATTAWVPSPTAATLHALHYHEVDVAQVQKELLQEPCVDYTDALLEVPLTKGPSWSEKEIEEEIENNCQGILGYVVRWIEQGVGCSKVPNIHDVGLMEDRATCRISSQHLANWLLHGIVTQEQVKKALRKMALVVDKQNADDPLYRPMAESFDTSNAFHAASDLIFLGEKQPNGYTEPLLHAWRSKEKQQH